MDTDKCKVLLRTVQLGSMSATSAELGYTPSGVSYIIDTIEAELGFKILNRKQSGISPTQAGEQILPSFEALLEAQKHLVAESERIKENLDPK